MSLKLKTILGVAFIEASLLALLVTLTINYLESTNFDGLEKRAKTTSHLFASTTKDAVLSSDLASLDTFCAELITNPDILYVKVVSPDGRVFSQAGQEKYLSRPFLFDTDIRAIDDGVYDFAASIIESGDIYGRVEIGIDISILEKQLKDVRRISAMIAVVEMSLVALFSYLLGSYLVNRLTRVRDAAVAIASGAHDVEVKVSGNDEVSDLATAFNEMSRKLSLADERRHSYEEDLKFLNQELESRVQRRTSQLNRNIEELKETNQTLKQTQARLVQSEKLASIGTLAAGVAHEINNPISFITSNIRVLKEYLETYDGAINRIFAIQEADGEEREKRFNDLKQWLNLQDMSFIQADTASLLTDSSDGLERVRVIVAGLNEFSHSDHEARQEETDLNQLVEQTLAFVSRELSDIAVVTKLPPLPLVMVNRNQIRDVLLNLIMNAKHAMMSGKGKLLIKSTLSDGMASVSITDNGIGMDAATVKKVFDPFFTTKEVGEGTGLGLSIAYGIMEEHGGEIKVQSKAGMGSRFTLSFPIVSPT